MNVDPRVMAMVKEFLGDRQTGRIFQSRNGTLLVHSNVNWYVALKELRHVKKNKEASIPGAMHGH